MYLEELNLKSSKSLYLQIAENIERKIINKEIAVGQKISTVRELQKQFGVSLDTAYEAILKLERRGYVVGRRSQGTIVISSEPKKEIDLDTKNSICLVICSSYMRSTFDAQWFYRFINGVEGNVNIKEGGIDLLYKTISEEDDKLDFSRNEKDIGGLIVAGNITPKHIRIIKKTKIPFIQIGDVYRKMKTKEQVDIIGRDDFHAVYLATKHLINLGHKRIAYVDFTFSEYPWNIEQLKGYKEALREANIVYDKDLLINTGSVSFNNVYRVVNKFLGKQIYFTGYICSGFNELYFGSMKAFDERNIKIPKDISVVFYGNLPRVTAVTHDLGEMGRVAVERLFERLTKIDWKPEKLFVPVTLVDHGSTRQLEK
jgi:DNA-binding LacI/PurR family transcriptional regulator